MTISHSTTGPLTPPPQYEVTVQDDCQEKLLIDVAKFNVEPLWTKMTKLNPPTPMPKAIAHKFE